jgi:hypothetical protein
MALDRDGERVLEMVRLSGHAPYETLTAPEACELLLAAREVLTADPPSVVEIRDLSRPIPIGMARRKSRCGSPCRPGRSRDTSRRC